MRMGQNDVEVAAQICVEPLEGARPRGHRERLLQHDRAHAGAEVVVRREGDGAFERYAGAVVRDIACTGSVLRAVQVSAPEGEKKKKK